MIASGRRRVAYPGGCARTSLFAQRGRGTWPRKWFVNPRERNVHLVRFLALLLGVELLAGCGGSATSATPLCGAKNLRVGRPTWVSPITGVNMSGVRVTNVGSRSCELAGWPHVVATANGLPSVVAVEGAYGLTVPNTPPVKLTIRPLGWASVLFAVSHSCEPQPAHRYDRLVLTIRGREFAVALPARARSANPSFRGFDLRMAVSPSCPPAVSPFLSSR
jgi:hypothetical protein